MNIFNAAEVIDMGIEKEKRRRDFYAMVAEKFTGREMKSLFTRLRDWETEHVKKFTEIRNSAKEDETAESFPGELASYMKAVVDEKLYKEVSPEKFGKNVKTPLEAIRYGISFEKDSIIFFNELIPAMGPFNKDAVQKLIDEEKQHIIYLAELKKKSCPIKTS